MATYTTNKILLEFELDPGRTMASLASVLVPILEGAFATGSNFRPVCPELVSETSTTQMWSNSDNSIIAVCRLHINTGNPSILTIDIDLPATMNNSWKTSPQTALQRLEDHIRSTLSSPTSATFQQIPLLKLGRRGPNSSVNPYFTTSDFRVVEYPLREVLFDRQSDIQRVQIVDSVDHGRILVLDGFVNIAESDTESYTHKLMGLPELASKYGGTRILILGGGDGGLLKELLDHFTSIAKEGPAYVHMVDIDPVVMNACSKFMPKVCGEYLSKREGPRYTIVEGDAFEEMEKLKSDPEQRFDFIFGDLTDTPIQVDESGDKCDANSNPDNVTWTFIKEILASSIRLLKPGGRYMTHCQGKSAVSAVNNYEKMAAELGMDILRRESFVPSFMEVWVFYELTKKRRS